jgi:hypothetical protein
LILGPGDVVQSLALDLTTHTLYVSDKGAAQHYRHQDGQL